MAAQDNSASWTLRVRGVVTENDRKLPGAVITVYDGATVVSTDNSSDGRFDLQLDPDKDYVITFTKPGYITKRISFSTKNIPADRGKYGFAPFTIEEVDIFPEIPGTDIDQILQQPVAKINYDSKYHNGDFNFDEKYTESIQTLLDKILAAKKALDAQYKKIITKADAEFGKKTWDDARTDYTAALKLKPAEQYPKDQLAAIEKAIADEKKKEEEDAKKNAGQRAMLAKYDSIIKLADAAYAAVDYDKAKQQYNAALQVIPGKKYPQDQIALIDKAIQAKKDAAENALKQKGLAAIQAKYDSIIRIADAAFQKPDYDKAKSEYNAALGVIPEKKYPKDQLAAIDKALQAKKDAEEKAARQKGLAAINARYDSIVKLADAAFLKKDYDKAKSQYNEALGVIADRRYPKDQIALIDKTIAGQKAAEERAAKQKSLNAKTARYDSIVRLADEAFQKKDYEKAKSEYTAASAENPSKNYPKTQLALVDKAIAAKKNAEEKAAKQKMAQSEYDSVIKIADAAYKKRDYKTAKDAYTKATEIKPDKEYPVNQLALIDRLTAAKNGALERQAKQKAIDAQYDSIIKIADAAFQNKDYPTAKDQYTAALQVKPIKTYPKQQLAAIERLMNPHKKPTPLNRDSIAKARQLEKKVDTAKPEPVVHIPVLPCNIKMMSDTCKRYLRPFLYEGVNALHLPLRDDPQTKEVNFPAFAGQRYRIIINLSCMPEGTEVVVYDEDEGHKKRKALFTAGDGEHRVSTFDYDGKSGHFFIDYIIPAKSATCNEACGVLMVGYETKK